MVSDMRCAITKKVEDLYEAYFGCKLGDQDKSFAPHMVSKLRMWSSRELKPFGIPMIWREQKNHYDDCYFCMTNIRGFNKANKYKIVYPNLPSALRPAPHSDDVPVPVSCDKSQDFDTNVESDCESEEGTACTIVHVCMFPHLIVHQNF